MPNDDKTYLLPIKLLEDDEIYICNYSHHEELIIEVFGKKLKKRISFGDTIYYFLVQDEFLVDDPFLKLFTKLTKEEFKSKFFEVKNSELIKMILTKNGGFYSNVNCHHYILLTDDYVLNIVAGDEYRIVEK